MTFYMWVAMLGWCLLTVGLIKRSERLLHSYLMRSGMFVDVALVVYLQLSRDAVQTAATGELSIPVYIHIIFSTLAVILYFPTLYSGWKLLNGNTELRDRHVKTGLSAYVFRTLGLFFMFSMWQH